MKLKDKKIELLRQVHTRDEMGITTTTLESMGTVWAYFRHLSGKEVFAAATVNYKEEGKRSTTGTSLYVSSCATIDVARKT